MTIEAKYQAMRSPEVLAAELRAAPEFQDDLPPLPPDIEQGMLLSQSVPDSVIQPLRKSGPL